MDFPVSRCWEDSPATSLVIHRCWVSNSGPHGCLTIILPTEPHPRPLFRFGVCIMAAKLMEVNKFWVDRLLNPWLCEY